MKKLLSLLTLVGVVVALAAACSTARAADAAPEKARIFELRTYITNPGKLPDLHKRFRDHTCRIFQKHGIELIAFWTPIEKPACENTLIYVVAFPSVEAQKKAWEAFKADPEWKKVFAESHKNGIIVKEVQSVTMKATDYSGMR